jgi:SAM-dependent methyltransferase
MSRTVRLKPDDIVLDLGCGKGATAIFLVKHYGVKVLALDLWTSAEFLNEKFEAQGYADRISVIQMDATQPLPFPENYFAAQNAFCADGEQAELRPNQTGADTESTPDRLAASTIAFAGAGFRSSSRPTPL